LLLINIADRYNQEFVDRAEKQIPLGRSGTAEEVAHLVVFLASEKMASYITGETYYIVKKIEIRVVCLIVI